MSCVLNKHCLLGLRVGLGDLKYTEDDWHTLHPVPIIITTYVLVIPAKMVSFQVPEHLFLTAARLPENAWHDLSEDGKKGLSFLRLSHLTTTPLHPSPPSYVLMTTQWWAIAMTRNPESQGKKRMSWSVKGLQMVKVPAAHTPTRGRGRLVKCSG